MSKSFKKFLKKAEKLVAPVVKETVAPVVREAEYALGRLDKAVDKQSNASELSDLAKMYGLTVTGGKIYVGPDVEEYVGQNVNTVDATWSGSSMAHKVKAFNSLKSALEALAQYRAQTASIEDGYEKLDDCGKKMLRYIATIQDDKDVLAQAIDNAEAYNEQLKFSLLDSGSSQNITGISGDTDLDLPAQLVDRLETKETKESKFIDRGVDDDLLNEMLQSGVFDSATATTTDVITTMAPVTTATTTDVTTTTAPVTTATTTDVITTTAPVTTATTATTTDVTTTTQFFDRGVDDDLLNEMLQSGIFGSATATTTDVTTTRAPATTATTTDVITTRATTVSSTESFADESVVEEPKKFDKFKNLKAIYSKLDSMDPDLQITEFIDEIASGELPDVRFSNGESLRDMMESGDINGIIRLTGEAEEIEG